MPIDFLQLMPIDYFLLPLYCKPLILLDRIYFEMMILAINIQYQELLKSRDITQLTKVCTVKAMVFPVVMYECESRTIKTECQRIDVFELWCWKRPLRVPQTARRSNQSIIKEINPEYSWEGLMLQCSGHLMQKANSLEKTLIL